MTCVGLEDCFRVTTNHSHGPNTPLEHDLSYILDRVLLIPLPLISGGKAVPNNFFYIFLWLLDVAVASVLYLVMVSLLVFLRPYILPAHPLQPPKQR